MIQGAEGLDVNAASLFEYVTMLDGKTGEVRSQIDTLEQFVTELVERASSIAEAQSLIEDGVDGNVKLAQSMATLASRMGGELCGVSSKTLADSLRAVAVAPAAELDSIAIPEIAVVPDTVAGVQAAAVRSEIVEALRAVNLVEAATDTVVAAQVAKAIAASQAAVEADAKPAPAPQPDRD
jgi:uncharacterized phage infection (PIP) family protein YhgE